METGAWISGRLAKEGLHAESENVLSNALTYPNSSRKEISENCDFSKSRVWKIRNELSVHPYLPKLNYALLDGHAERKLRLV